jgi:hypothetical protein
MLEELEPELLALEQHLSKFNFPEPNPEWVERTSTDLGQSNRFASWLRVVAAVALTLSAVGGGVYQMTHQTHSPGESGAPEITSDVVISFQPQDFPKEDIEIKLNPFQNYDGLTRAQIAERRRTARKAYPALEKLIPKDYNEDESPLLKNLVDGLPWHRINHVFFGNTPDTKPLTKDSLPIENPYLLANLQCHYGWMNLQDQVPARQEFLDRSLQELTPVKLKLHSKERRLEIKYRFFQERGFCYLAALHHPEEGGAHFRLNCPNAYDLGFKWIILDFAKSSGIREDKVRFDTLRSVAIAGQPVEILRGVNFNCLDLRPVTSPLVCLDSLPAHISARLFLDRPKNKDQRGDLDLTVDIEAAPSMNGNTNFKKIREEQLKAKNKQ